MVHLARLVGKDLFLCLNCGCLLLSGETVVKSLTCDDLDLDVTDYILPSSEEERISIPSLPSLEKSNSVPLGVPKVPPLAASWAPWVTTGLVLMGLKSYFPQLPPVSSLWSPLRAAIPVLHWVASWWFVSLGRELNLVGLAPLSHIGQSQYCDVDKPQLTEVLGGRRIGQGGTAGISFILGGRSRW
ncbi:hypothetical protein DSO57_1009200 [Entomophthora muscae]|uniref:Uncharacterized protein n=1 Tax=Entomophthora muscae TaxID=34485 RepID=A0ACC2U4Y9_9FUNG|nr:hypothetical protein DSO57_1009200 [Entomophthora muscae]